MNAVLDKKFDRMAEINKFIANAERLLLGYAYDNPQLSGTDGAKK